MQEDSIHHLLSQYLEWKKAVKAFVASHPSFCHEDRLRALQTPGEKIQTFVAAVLNIVTSKDEDEDDEEREDGGGEEEEREEEDTDAGEVGEVEEVEEVVDEVEEEDGDGDEVEEEDGDDDDEVEGDDDDENDGGNRIRKIANTAPTYREKKRKRRVLPPSNQQSQSDGCIVSSQSQSDGSNCIACSQSQSQSLDPDEIPFSQSSSPSARHRNRKKQYYLYLLWSFSKYYCKMGISSNDEDGLSKRYRTYNANFIFWIETLPFRCRWEIAKKYEDILHASMSQFSHFSC